MNDAPIRFSRTALLCGEEALRTMAEAKILIVGLGGVGGHAAENLVRAGIGHLTLLDGDTVELSNCNRQIIALSDTVGRSKAEVLAERCRQIDPDGGFIPVNRFLRTPEEISRLLETPFDYVIDAIDDVPVKIELIRQLKLRRIPFVSAMGAGGKTDPSRVTVADISRTSGCPLAKTVRKKLKELGIRQVRCVFSPETPKRSFEHKKIGSISYMAAIFGCFCAAEAIRVLTGIGRGGEARRP